jgi:pimeloyl-ACP methyl ester carboxylesterase
MFALFVCASANAIILNSTNDFNYFDSAGSGAPEVRYTNTVPGLFESSSDGVLVKSDRYRGGGTLITKSNYSVAGGTAQFIWSGSGEDNYMQVVCGTEDQPWTTDTNDIESTMIMTEYGNLYASSWLATAGTIYETTVTFNSNSYSLVTTDYETGQTNGTETGSFDFTMPVYLYIRTGDTYDNTDAYILLQSLTLSLIPSFPTIAQQPQSQMVQAGSNVTINVAANGSPPLSYQWFFNGGQVPGQTNTTFQINNIQLSNGGNYSVTISNTYGFTNSAIAQLTVYTNLVLIQTNRTPPTTAIGPPTIPTDATHFKVFTNGYFQSGIALNPNLNTAVLTHGWNSSSTDWPQDMAQLIQQRIGSNTVNLVAWDWTAEAQSAPLDLAGPTQNTPGEGFALGTNLVAALGANYSHRIHFIGHSLGTLVNAAAANYVHSHGFSWTNTQITLCDDAEIAWDFSNPNDPQFASTVYATVTNLEANFSTSQPFWGTTLPNQFAWADNYITAFGLLHPGAANVILTYSYPATVEDFDTLEQEFLNYHDYSYDFYEDTIEPNILMYNGGQTNATFAGFISSYEGGGASARPATNTYFYQDRNGLELNLVQIDMASATNFLNDRFNNFLAVGAFVGQNSSLGNWWTINGISVLGEVVGQQTTVGLFLKAITSGGIGSLAQTSGARPLGGPAPNGGGANNTPAYIWIPLNIPSNAVSISFDFMLQGNGNQDSFQAALNGTNVLSLETSLIQTNIALNSGMINVSQYAGQQVELFLGIVGGTSTNASLTLSDFNLYVALPPSLKVQLSGTNFIVAWPLSASGYTLETTTNLSVPNSWTIVTNMPSIVNFQYIVTNQISSGSVFYRLAIITAPILQTQVSGNNIILSWPTSATGYSLETTTNLADPNSWMTLTNVPAIVNLQNAVTNPVVGSQGYYRLIQSQ